MVVVASFARTSVLLFFGLLITGSLGCQTGQQVSSRQLIQHQALIDFSGLGTVEKFDPLQISIAAPRNWEVLTAGSNALYRHEQWRSPSTHTGVGVLYVHLPLPLSAKTVVWLAKQEYSKQNEEGRVIAEWTDALGRSWFEAENKKYRVRGFVVTQGFSAWVVYFGYRVRFMPNLAEINLASRATETVAPMLDPAPQPTAIPTP
jgi:hypothetical protein